MILQFFLIACIISFISSECIFTSTECTCLEKPEGSTCLRYEFSTTLTMGGPQAMLCSTYQCGPGYTCNCAGRQVCDIRDCGHVGHRPASMPIAGQVPPGLVQCEDILDNHCVKPKKPRCYRFNCGKCGQLLECHVNTGIPAEDDTISNFISSESPNFCAAGLAASGGVRTPCGQQCAGSSGTSVVVGSDWPGCPSAAIRADTCTSGMQQSLSNFASYTICLTATDTVESITCSGEKCDSGTCPCQMNVM